MKNKTEIQDTNRYTLKWNGHTQPLGSNSFHSVKMYIENSLRQGGCYLWQFEILTQWGKLKTNIIYKNDANPMLTENYALLF